MGRSTGGRLAGTVVGITVTCAGTVAAHGGHAVHRDGGPLALFVVGVAVLGASVYLDANDAVSRRTADVGVLVGLLAVLAAIPWNWL